jgi:hypothetical protein
VPRAAHRSQARRFARKLREGGDTHGCQAALRPDFLALLKTLKHEDLSTLEAALSDHPLGGLAGGCRVR